MLQRSPAPPHLSSSIADSGPGEEDINQTDGERRGNVLLWTSGSTWQPAIIRPALSPHLHIYSLYIYTIYSIYSLQVWSSLFMQTLC